MLDLIGEEMARLGINFFRLDGKTPSQERSEMADRFNAGERGAFLVSLKAGGTGLNLIGADMVIHYDPWWNPAAEDQASDRAYRIGQTRAVQVIKLAVEGTIEEKVLQMQGRKKDLIDTVIRPGETFISKLSKEQMLALFEK
jgi:SNF2 family DNA or RNA helicase